MTTNKKGINAVEAGIMGAAIGAAIGAGAVALSDPKNRKKIAKKFNDLKKSGEKVYEDLKDKVEELSTEGQDKIKVAKKALKAKL